MSYAVTYLFNSKESGVQTYIGNRIFSFPGREVDFYLQQLVNMYIHMHDVAEVLHPYLVRAVIKWRWQCDLIVWNGSVKHKRNVLKLNIFCFQVYRCRESVDFSLQCAWLLDAYSSDASLPTQKKSHGTKLKNLILSDELRPNTTASSSAAGNAVKSMKGHQHHTVVKITPLPTVTGHQGKENLSHLSIQVSPEEH